MSKVYCKYNISPSISNLISYLDNNNYYKITTIETCNNIYFDKISHHLFITPYLLDNLDFIDKDNKYLVNIMNIMNYYITNVFNIDNINLRNIDPDIFLNNLNQLIYLFDNIESIKILYENKFLIL